MNFFLILFFCFFIQTSLTMMSHQSRQSFKIKNSKVFSAIDENDSQDKSEKSLKYGKDKFRTQKIEKKLTEYIKSIKPKGFRDKNYNINSKYSQGVWFRIG